MNIKVKHINQKHSSADGARIYIDPIWTDGAFTRFVNITEWNKEVAPSYDLWRFYGSPEKWAQFEELYDQELNRPDKAEAVDAISAMANDGPVTLLYGNGSELHNSANFLKTYIEKRTTTAKKAA